MFRNHGPVIMLVAFMMMSLLFALSFSNLRSSDELVSVSSDTEIGESDLSLFSEFQEASKEEILNIVDNQYIEKVGFAGQDIYLITTSGEKYWYNDSTNELLFYMRFQGYEPFVISDSRIDVSHNEVLSQPLKSFTYDVLPWRTICILLILIGLPTFILSVVVHKNLKRREATQGVGIVGSDIGSITKTGVVKKQEVPSVKFSDVEGVDELKQDVFRLVDCLKNPQKYRDIGARTPKGVILYGPPGTGKTLLAKAIAGEANVPFFHAVGSDFMEKYVGIGAKRVRELYAKAKKVAPCIVFIDEVDAIASRRGQSENGERDQTINALLSELDGFDKTVDVITICATNRLELLDEAFKRAGRFDVKLAVGLPDLEARERILQLHAKNKKLSDEIDLSALAKRCVGFSGADLEALLNESAMVAVGKGHLYVMLEDIDDAFFKVIMQGNKHRRKSVTDVNKIVAWHEAGHTLVTKLLTDDNVPSVTIVGSSSGAGGATFRAPKEEVLHSRKYLKSMILVMYAGRAAEQIYLGDEDLITTGASQDIKQATSMIKDYLSSYGMGDMGMLDISQLRHDYEDIIGEASEFAKSSYTEVLNLLMDNKDKLERIAMALLDKETLCEEEIDNLLVA